MCSQETTHSNNMNQKNNLVKNASFLMIAAMISKVIGLLYKSPLSNIIGSLGMGYTSLAQNAYMILLMIASFSIPQAVSKLISERIALKDYRNAHKFFKGAMIYAMVVGGAVALFCLFGAGLIIPKNQKDAILALQILAPTIFLSGILGVFRGYFQAYRNMMLFTGGLFGIGWIVDIIRIAAGSYTDSHGLPIK